MAVDSLSATDRSADVSVQKEQSAMVMPAFSINDVCVAGAPSNQHMVDLIPDWTSWFPPEYGAKAGNMGLCCDSRVAWAIDALGGIEGKSIIELGPLEAGHTFMLERAGAKSIKAIEANKRCFMKCLIAKEIFGLRNARFLLGDFVKYLDNDADTYDVAWVAGVLYHMEDPVHLLEQIGKRSRSMYLWTQYIDDDALKVDWVNKIVGQAVVDRLGRKFEYFYRSYEGAQASTIFTGGVYSGAVWLRKEAIMEALTLCGFSEIVVESDNPKHPNGPAITLIAKR